MKYRSMYELSKQKLLIKKEVTDNKRIKFFMHNIKISPHKKNNISIKIPIFLWLLNLKLNI